MALAGRETGRHGFSRKGAKTDDKSKRWKGSERGGGGGGGLGWWRNNHKKATRKTTGLERW